MRDAILIQIAGVLFSAGVYVAVLMQTRRDIRSIRHQVSLLDSREQARHTQYLVILTLIAQRVGNPGNKQILDLIQKLVMPEGSHETVPLP